MQVTLPLPGAADDGRPKALQIETSAIKAKNCPLSELRVDSHFSSAMQAVRQSWLLTSQDSNQFPHYRADLRALPTRLQQLLSQQVRVGRRRGQSVGEDSGSATGVAPEENRAELVSIEGWRVSTSCIHVAFASNYTHTASLHTKSFIDDFPIYVWLFLPPSSLDTSLPSSPPSDHTSPPSDHTSPPLLLDPRFSIIAHVPSDVRVELERLQLLFIMRLKDSLTAFKSSLMKFLDPETFAPNLKETLEAHRSAASKEEEEEEEVGEGVGPEVAPLTISGCIVLNRVEASILLPTLYTSRTPTSPHTPSTTPYQDNSTNHTASSREATPTRKATPTRETTPTRVSPHLEELSLTAEQLAPPLDTPSPSPAPSESPKASRTSLSGSGSVHSSHSPYTSTLSLVSSPSPSLVSLPTHNSHASASSLLTTPPSHTLPVRSLSAVELPVGGVAAHSGGAESCEGKEDVDDEDYVVVKYPSPQKMPHPSSPTPSPGKWEGPLEVSQVSMSPGLSLSPSPSAHSSATTSTRRIKTPPPLRKTPQFVLHAQVEGLFAVPNITAGQICAKLTTGTIALRELSSKEYQGMKELRQKKASTRDFTSLQAPPTIKARLEVGEQVGRFYPSESAQEQDIILIAKAEGLDLSLLLPNITIMKDFFDDEYESVVPLPLHVKVATTRAVLVEDLAHSADHVQSMAVGVEQLEVHRGRELRQDTDIFLESGSQDASRYYCI